MENEEQVPPILFKNIKKKKKKLWNQGFYFLPFLWLFYFCGIRVNFLNLGRLSFLSNNVGRENRTRLGLQPPKKTKNNNKIDIFLVNKMRCCRYQQAQVQRLSCHYSLTCRRVLVFIASHSPPTIPLVNPIPGRPLYPFPFIPILIL